MKDGLEKKNYLWLLSEMNIFYIIIFIMEFEFYSVNKIYVYVFKIKVFCYVFKEFIMF